jgi:hypothetical protein
VKAVLGRRDEPDVGPLAPVDSHDLIPVRPSCRGDMDSSSSELEPSVWHSERYYFVRCSMIRPKVRSVESKRTARKRDNSDILNFGRFLPRIETRDAPILVRLLLSAEDVDRAVNEGVTADLLADIDNAQNLSARIEFQNAMFVPLTQVEMIAVAAEI